MNLGVDIGGTKLAVGVEQGPIEGSTRKILKEPVPGEGRPEEVITRALEMAGELCGSERPTAVGVSIGGPLDHRSGVVVNFPHLPEWKDVPLANIIANELGLPVAIDNDANLGGLAEYRHACAHGLEERDDPFVYMTLSTGIGGGVIVGGRLVHGVRTGAGELGHITVAPEGPLCACGNRGCLEQMASGTNIALRGRAMVREDRRGGAWLLEQAGGDVERVRAETVVAGYRAGDQMASTIWLDAVHALAIGLGSIVHVLAPRRVVLGGGLSLAGEALLDPLNEALKQHVFYVRLDQIEISTAALGHDSALIGALHLARDISRNT